MRTRVKEIIRKRSNIIVKKEVDLDMIVDYFSYVSIFGEDVAPDADKIEVNIPCINVFIFIESVFI